MSSVAEIEQAISKLSTREFVELEDWLAAERNRKWDQQIAEDSASGALDFLLREVEEEVTGPTIDSRRWEPKKRRKKNAANLAAFEKLLPKLLKTDSGKFVAFFDGQLVGKNVDRLELLKTLPRHLRPASSLLIRQVVENQEPDVIVVNRPISGE